MANLIRKVYYVLYGRSAEKRHAQRVAEEIAAKEKAAEQQRNEELHRQGQIAEQRALEAEAAERRRVQEIANQARLEQQRAAWEALERRRAEEEAARQRRLGNPFQVGERYENRKGFFTVIGLTETEVHMRWDSGEEFVDTIESQQRILRNMERGEIDWEAEGPHVERYRPTVAYCAYCGRPLTSPKYYNGQPYGSNCIQYVRGY